MSDLITFEYSSVHGGLAAAYTSGALASEFGPERVRVALAGEATARLGCDPLLSELPLAAAAERRDTTRLLGLVPDGDTFAWALVTSHEHLAERGDLVVRALLAVLQARPHRQPSFDTFVGSSDWICDSPLRSARILSIDSFVASAANLAA